MTKHASIVYETVDTARLQSARTFAQHSAAKIPSPKVDGGAPNVQATLLSPS